MTFTNDELFNCCTNAAEPDWTTYRELVLEGCRDMSEDPDAGTDVSGGFDRYEAEFFSVYGITAEGYADAITDAPDVVTAERILWSLSDLSGLPCRFHETL